MSARGRRGRQRERGKEAAKSAWRELHYPYAPIEPLMPEQLNFIDDSAMTVLEDDRMHIQDGEARSILRDKGFTVDESEERVRIGEGHFALTAVGGPPFVSDLDGGRRAGTFADQLNFLKLVAMSDLMQIMGGACVEAQDLPADTRYLDYYLACCTLSDKAWKPLTIGRHRAARRHRNGQDLAWRERRATGGRSGILYTQHQHQHAAGAGCRDRPGRHRIHPSRPARSRSRPLRSLAPCRRQRSPVH